VPATEKLPGLLPKAFELALERISECGNDATRKCGDLLAQQQASCQGN
jgi:hypothetical protein